MLSRGETGILRPMPTPEDHAREHIDQALEQAGWKVQDYKNANLHAGRGVALRNFPLVSGHGFADYLLYVDSKAAGIIEAKKEGVTLIGVEVQAEKYSNRFFMVVPDLGRGCRRRLRRHAVPRRRDTGAGDRGVFTMGTLWSPAPVAPNVVRHHVRLHFSVAILAQRFVLSLAVRRLRL